MSLSGNEARIQIGDGAVEYVTARLSSLVAVAAEGPGSASAMAVAEGGEANAAAATTNDMNEDEK